MDIRCPQCSEPWDLDSLHDEVAERFPDQLDRLRARPRSNHAQRQAFDRAYGKLFDQVRSDFRAQGCKALGSSHGTTVASPLIAEVLDLLGGDLDGAASLLDDASQLGLFA